ncbi:MAG: molecular chaperone DjiA [Bacteroidales bacterium]|nr:molecular chaperone DjiA [Bacteroidales bacterium]
MAKYSKWLGGGLGWVLGGPIGGLVGFMFGSMFDSMNKGEFEYVDEHGHPYGGQSRMDGEYDTMTEDRNTTRPGDFAMSLLILSASVMKADGRIVKAELDFVKEFFRLKFGDAQAAQLMLVLRELVKKDIPLFEVGNQIRNYMDYAARLQLVHYLFGISMADGRIDASEISIIEQIADILDLDSQDLQSLKAMFVQDNQSPYKILEMTSDASDEDLKKAYKKMALKYHPDKVNHLGEDVRKGAEEKFQSVNAAYDQIKKQRGII